MPFILDRTPPLASAIGGALGGYFQTKSALDQQERENQRQDAALALEQQRVQAEIAKAGEAAKLNRMAEDRLRQLGTRELDVREKGIEADLQIAKRRFPDWALEAGEREAEFQRQYQEAQLLLGMAPGLGASGTLAGSKAASQRASGMLGLGSLPAPEGWMQKSDLATYLAIPETDTTTRQAFAAGRYMQYAEEKRRQTQSRVERIIADNPKGPSGRSAFDPTLLKQVQDAMSEGQVFMAEGLLNGAIAEFEREEALSIEAQAYVDMGRRALQSADQLFKVEDLRKPIDESDLEGGGVTRIQRISQIMGSLERISRFGSHEDDLSVVALGEELMALVHGNEYGKFKKDRAEREAAAARAAQEARYRGAVLGIPMGIGRMIEKGRKATEAEVRTLKKRAVPLAEWSGGESGLTQIIQAQAERGEDAARLTAARLGLDPGDPSIPAALAEHVQKLRSAIKDLESFFAGGGYDAQAEAEYNELKALLDKIEGKK